MRRQRNDVAWTKNVSMLKSMSWEGGREAAGSLPEIPSRWCPKAGVGRAASPKRPANLKPL